MTSSSIFALLLAYRYWILLPLAFVEGPIIAVAAGWLISLNLMAIVPVYIILILGDLIPDTLYYGIGRLSHRANFLARHGHRVGITSQRLAAIERLWHKHAFKSVLISKWAYGLSTPLLISAGLARVPARRFLSLTSSISVAQYGILITIGYYFGSSYQLIGTYIEHASWFVALGAILFFAAYFFASRYAKRTLLQETK